MFQCSGGKKPGLVNPFPAILASMSTVTTHQTHQAKDAPSRLNVPLLASATATNLVLYVPRDFLPDTAATKILCWAATAPAIALFLKTYAAEGGVSRDDWKQFRAAVAQTPRAEQIAVGAFLAAAVVGSVVGSIYLNNAINRRLLRFFGARTRFPWTAIGLVSLAGTLAMIAVDPEVDLRR